MRMRVSPVAILLPGLLLGACSTLPLHQPLAPDAQGKIASTDVVLPVHQSEIYVFVPNSSAGAVAVGGLIGALVDAGINDVRTSKAETAVKPLRDVLVDYSFDSALQADVKQSLGQVAWVHGDDYRVVRDNTPDGLDGVLGASKDSAILFVVSDYRLSNDGDVLDVTTFAKLFPNDDALKSYVQKPDTRTKSADDNTIYRNMFVYEVRLPGATDDRDKNIAAWSADNGALMRAALDQGAKETAAMLAADIQDGDRPAADATAMNLDPPATVTPVPGVPISTSARVVSDDASGRLVRCDDGTLRYAAATVAPETQPASAPVASAPAAAPPTAAQAPAAQPSADSGAASAHPAS